MNKTLFGRRPGRFLMMTMAAALSTVMLNRPVHAQTGKPEAMVVSPGVTVMTLADMIEQAVRLSEDTALASLSVDAARARLDAVNGAGAPRLDLNVSNDVTSLYDPFTGVVATTVINGQPVSVDVTRSQPRSILSANLRLSYPILTGGRLKAQGDAARAGVSAAHAQSDITAVKVTRDVTLAWFEAHRMNQRVATEQAQLILTMQLAELINQRVTRGLSARIDGEAADNDIASRQARIEQLMASRSAAWISLARARGLADIPPEPDWATFTNSQKLGDSIAQLRGLINSNALPRQQEELVAAAQAEVRSAGATGKPNVSLFAQYQAIGRSDGTEWLAINNLRRSDLVIGARVEWNLFDGGQTTARVAEKSAELNRQQLQRDRTRRYRQFATAEAQQKLIAERHQLDALNSSIRLHSRKIEIARIKLKSGRADRRDLTRLQRELEELTGDIRQTQLDLLLAHTRLLFARALPQ
ncbi:MAG: TolC family protein [Burkholderiaceae bacterium]